MLNLQTIAGSRFVVAFVDRVKSWEKTLNVVSECLEVWFTVQVHTNPYPSSYKPLTPYSSYSAII